MQCPISCKQMGGPLLPSSAESLPLSPLQLQLGSRAHDCTLPLASVVMTDASLLAGACSEALPPARAPGARHC